VSKPIIQDWDLFNSVVLGGPEAIFNDAYTSLAAFARIRKVLLHCSPAFCDMLHYTEVECHGFLFLLPSKLRPCFRKNFKEMNCDLSW